MSSYHDQSPLPSALVSWTGYLLYWVSRHAATLYSDALNPLSLSPHQVGILQLLAAEGPIVQSTVSSRLRLDKGSLSREVRNLLDQDLITSHRPPGDQRARVLALSSRGLARLQAIEQRNAQVTRDLFAPLSSDDLKQLHGLLDRLARHATATPPPVT